MNGIMLVSTQLTGSQQAIAKWVLFGSVALWVILKIIVKWKGRNE